ncbi:MAG: InlB B-repeat-containing protein, partial [Vicinamibacterales bacterium]
KRSAPASPKTQFSLRTYVLPIWLRVKGLGQRSPSPSRRQAPLKGAGGRGRGNSSWTPTTRGALIAVAAVAAAAVFLLGAIQTVRWLWPSGQRLTVTRPSGGTIVGAGLECGTRGSDCSTTLPDGEAVELQTQPDADYVFGGFIGDCAPTGRLIMNGAKTCTATFQQVAKVKGSVEWPLTIRKPTGGTIVALGGILCGTLGETCSASLPDGEVVTLRVESDSGHKFLTFTDDCAGDGNTTMTAARTCGATFGPTTTPSANVVPRTDAPPVPRKGSQAVKQAQPPPTTSTPQGPGQPPAGVTGTPTATGTQSPPASTATQGPDPTNPNQKPAEGPITAEAHAQREIEQLVKQYCAEYETLQPERIQKLYPQVDVRALRNQFKEYKSLKCSVSAPKFDRLDASPAGGAQVKVEMKQVIQMESGGAPKAHETIATIVISRMDLRRPWLIDRVLFEQKPMP